MFETAPWYWLAMRLASVSPGSKIDRFSGMKLPITCVTAIASPSARPSPRMTAATTPPRTVRQDDALTISQRVAPSPIAPSSSSRRDADEELAADRRRDRDDHDRQDDHRREDRRLDLVLARSRRSGSSRANSLMNGSHVLRVERREHEDPPEADHDARHRGEHVDQRPDRPADRTAARARSGRGRSRSRAAPR